MDVNVVLVVLLNVVLSALGGTIPLPSFKKLMYHYPGYRHFGGRYSHRKVIGMIGCSTSELLHDTSALRISMALNKIGGAYSIGNSPIRLSKHGKDSVSGRDNLQYLYHPLAFGPYFVDKYGYPNISVIHDKDPIATKHKFWGKQGIMEIITYTKYGNKPRGHIALWNCDRLYQAKDWISKHTLLTIQFWESPDSYCRNVSSKEAKTYKTVKFDTLRMQAYNKMYHKFRFWKQKARSKLQGYNEV